MNDLSENTLEVNVSDRRKTRVAMIQLLFEFEVAKHENNNFIEKSLEETININSNSEYIKKETERIIEYLDEIDDVIVNNLKGWTISRLAKVDLSILRIAIYEFIYRVDIPHQVSINEAIEIAKKFSTEESSKFINGILGSVYRKLMSEKE